MNRANNQSMGLREWSLLLLLSIIWGGSFFFGKVAVAQVPPFTLVLGRVGLAALLLNLFVIAAGQRMPRSPALWGRFLVMGALNNMIPFSLIFWGQTRIASGLASILNATTPLWAILLAHLLTHDERLTPGRLGGILLGIAGVVMIIGPDVLHGVGLNVLAQLAVIGATVSYALAGIFGKQFKDLPPMVTATGQLTAGALMVAPVALLIDQPWTLPLPGASIWGAVVGLAVLCTALAYVIYFKVLATAGATNLLLVTLLIPVSALLLGMLLLGERLDVRHFLGMGIIGIGLITIDGRIKLFPGRFRRHP